jgi:hypothetical protein
VLIVADDGHAPGTRVQILTEPFPGQMATIVGALWARTGPPIGYEVCPDGIRKTYNADPSELLVLSHQEGATTAVEG